MRRALCLALVALPPLAACGPVPVQEAERLCVEKANEALHPRGELALGVGSAGKPVGALDVTISTDFLLGRDPGQVFDACVKARSGQFPSRPLADQPGWVG
ncbi:hypothetical protein [Tabrizicola oligotrophica]|uniref:Lipoprotein n=1 Tax=Tabrizicola oligotrophica TaxID=2710650 RepID=A0A6M0QV88_9RHOB|nr:hypothetical protein [Tabrizicola oligotrophica]NEY90774.1 hypothetical protein [Tabrizicola oligotrophica]